MTRMDAKGRVVNEDVTRRMDAVVAVRGCRYRVNMGRMDGNLYLLIFFFFFWSVGVLLDDDLPDFTTLTFSLVSRTGIQSKAEGKGTSKIG
jgi:hypothetical protein